MLHLLWNCCKWNDPPFINSLYLLIICFIKNTQEFSPQPTMIAFWLLKFLPQDRSFLYFEQLRNSLFIFALFSTFLHYFDYFKVPFTTTKALNGSYRVSVLLVLPLTFHSFHSSRLPQLFWGNAGDSCSL